MKICKGCKTDFKKEVKKIRVQKALDKMDKPIMTKRPMKISSPVNVPSITVPTVPLIKQEKEKHKNTMMLLAGVLLLFWLKK